MCFCKIIRLSQLFQKKISFYSWVLRMDSISSPQYDYFILIHMYYLAFIHFVTPKHFASKISFIIYCFSYIFASDRPLTELCPFSKYHMLHEAKYQILLPRLPSLSQNFDFLHWGWFKSLMILVDVYWSPNERSTPRGSSHGKLLWL